MLGTRRVWDEGSRSGQNEKANSEAAALKGPTNAMGAPELDDLQRCADWEASLVLLHRPLSK